MNTSELQHWLGRTQTEHDTAWLDPARRMAATLDLAADPLQPGQPLPPLWHWLYFLEAHPRAQLGRDGHPARGGFLPPVALPNRMWAGGRVAFLAPLPLGAALERRSSVVSITPKQGRSGALVFVTVRHEVSADGTLGVREEHDIVYKGDTAGAPPPVAAPAGELAPPPPHDTLRNWTPDSTQLFRYSALTFNGHRIHYDADYCRSVEHYPNLVVHGPLVATQLAALGQEVAGRPLSRFDYRSLRPSFLGDTLRLCARRTEHDGIELNAVLPDGGVSMQAWACA